MRFPLTTGGAARLLDRLEPQLNDLIRRGKLSAPPPVTAGRRLWTREDILRAAKDLDLDLEKAADRLDESRSDAVAHGQSKAPAAHFVPGESR